MMASKKNASGGMRAPKRGKKKQNFMPYVGVVAVLAVLVIAAVLILGGGKKPAAKQQSAETSGAGSKSERPKLKKTTTRKKDKPKRERRSRSERKSRTRKSRTSRSTKKADANTLEAILEDPGGERYAMVDERAVKPGDVVGGRTVVSIESRSVTVEYHGKTYSVRIGQSIY